MYSSALAICCERPVRAACYESALGAGLPPAREHSQLKFFPRSNGHSIQVVPTPTAAAASRQAEKKTNVGRLLHHCDTMAWSGALVGDNVEWSSIARCGWVGVLCFTGRGRCPRLRGGQWHAGEFNTAGIPLPRPDCSASCSASAAAGLALGLAAVLFLTRTPVGGAAGGWRLAACGVLCCGARKAVCGRPGVAQKQGHCAAHR